MRTDKKLLLAFVAVVVLLMLFSDIVLWANLKKGIFGDKRADPYPKKVQNSIALRSVKVLKLTGHHMLGVTYSDSAFLLYDVGTEKNPFIWSQNGDTLTLKLLTEDGITLFCPNIQTILLSPGSNLRINDQYSLPRLTIRMTDSCYTELTRVKIGSLNITGGMESAVKVIEGLSEIDSFRLQLGKSGTFKSYDIPYNYISVKIDSIKQLELTGKSLHALKEIK